MLNKACHAVLDTASLFFRRLRVKPAMTSNYLWVDDIPSFSFILWNDAFYAFTSAPDLASNKPDIQTPICSGVVSSIGQIGDMRPCAITAI